MSNKILKTPTLQHYVEQVAGASSSGVTELPLENIDLSNTQFEYRLDPGLELLIESIKKDGQQIPVIVRGVKPPYQLICGFRRTRSIQAIGGGMVKAIILPEIDDDKAHRLSVLENVFSVTLFDTKEITLFGTGGVIEKHSVNWNCSVAGFVMNDKGRQLTGARRATGSCRPQV